MISSKKEYLAIRNDLAKRLPEIIALEKKYTSLLVNSVLLPVAEKIYQDFTISPLDLLPFWLNYPPEQRGRQPTGHSVPWLELGEKTISSNIISQLANTFNDITFPGLPTGGDIRFATKNLYIHLDIKLTGPNDNPDEIVVPPNQVSGDGNGWIALKGMTNSRWPIYYQKSKGRKKINYKFQPKLPPFYSLHDNTLICLTYFLKAVYSVRDFGNHPLEHFELSCVPNGLLMFDGPKYGNTSGLFIAGKDDNTKAEDTKRVRIRLDPLVSIDKWRSIKVVKGANGWVTKKR